MNKEQDICQHSVGMLKSGRAYCRNCGKEYILVDTPLPDKNTEWEARQEAKEVPFNESTEGWEKEFDKVFDGSWGDGPSVIGIKSFISSLLSQKTDSLLKALEEEKERPSLQYRHILKHQEYNRALEKAKEIVKKELQ